jgi:asparagine synthase (glutamine-hydrolysing)
MCGIVGLVYSDRERAVDPLVLRRMCSAIVHRGPDDEGLYVAGSAGLGMRRLSIIDLAGGSQPVFNETGSCSLVFNGEIYNYRDLRSQLQARGHQLRSAGDTETIVHLYEELGRDCPRALRGMFAFAIWDARRRTLLLARDRFGIKPLYYVSGPWGIAFASELKALLAAGVTERQLDWHALDAFLQLGYIPAPHTPFRDVRKLEPAQSLLWRDSGDVEIQSYWDLPTTPAAAPPHVERQALDWIDESVAAHLVSDVPVAAFLSGGLDSSTVVASAALAGSGAHVFTGRYHGSGADAADETGLARALANRYGAQLTVVDITPDLQDIFEPLVLALDEPHADGSIVPTWMLSAAVGASYKVALTGIGGDELFAGYRRHLGLLAVERYAALPQRVRGLATRLGDRLPDSLTAGLGMDRLKRFLRTGAERESTIGDRFFGMVSRIDESLRERLYRPDLRAHIARNAGRERFRALHAQAGRPHGLAAALYLDYKTFLPDDILALSDRLSMAHSLEIRVPLVDHVLVERVFPLPAHLKVGGWQLKRLLKRAAAPRLPEAHLRAPKRGFIGPTAAWLRHELRAVVRDELSPARVARLGYWEPDVVARLLDEHDSQRQNREGILWALLCFSTWHRLVMERPMPVSAPAEPLLALAAQPAAPSRLSGE